MKLNHILLCSLFAMAACGGDKTKDDAKSAAPDRTTESPDQYRKRQQAFADSVLGTTKPVAKVVAALGKGYAIGSVSLRDTIAALAQASNCFRTGRAADPYLAGTVSVFAHMSVVGVDLIQVQRSETKWTSPAGDLVNACIDTEAKKWKLDMTFGKPASYIVQVQFKSDTSMIRRAMADSFSAGKAKTVSAKKP
jgi:hypothetical protein